MKRLAEVEAELVHSTDKAYLIRSIQTGVKDWVPKSIVEYDEETSTFTMPYEFALDKEFI